MPSPVSHALPAPSFNRELRPTIGRGLAREPFARIVGDVRLGRDATVGRRTSIRADEGAPILIGVNAQIEDRVTFHALSGTSITIGDRLDTDDNVVFHGPLRVGNDLTIADDAILFRATVGDRVTVGDSTPNAVITTQADADALSDADRAHPQEKPSAGPIPQEPQPDGAWP